MIKINLYGGPGCGKSTLSALLFTELKLQEKKVELVREYAKEMVYQNHDMNNLSEETRLFILAEQLRRESILHDKVDFLITDSPILIAAYYYKNSHAIELTKDLLRDDELHFYIERDLSSDFEHYGRAQNFEESVGIDKEMKSFLKNMGVKFHRINGCPKKRLNQILKIMGIEKDTRKLESIFKK